MPYLFRRPNLFERCRRRCCAGRSFRQVPPEIHPTPNYPPHAVRYGNPNATSWPTTPTYYNQNQPILPCSRPWPRAPPLPSMRRTAWHNTTHTSQGPNIFTPPTRARLPEISKFPHPSAIHQDLCNPAGIYPFLDWDISKLPSSSRRCEDARTLLTPALNETAIFPRCDNVQIVFDHPTFHPLLGHFGLIMVYPLGNATEVKVENVIDAIYLHFQQPITLDEWDNISWPEQRQILRSFNSRISESPDLRGHERARCVLLVDLLKSCTRFAGLQNISILGRTARLYMSLAPVEES